MAMPVFVKVENYKDALHLVALIKSKIEEAKKSLEKVQQLKSEEDSELEQWHSQISEVERKIDFIDKTLSEPDTL